MLKRSWEFCTGTRMIGGWESYMRLNIIDGGVFCGGLRFIGGWEFCRRLGFISGWEFCRGTSSGGERV